MSAQRKARHESAKELMQRGDYLSASVSLQDTLREFQPYLGILLDLAFCFYALGSIELFLKTLAQVELEFGRCQEFLSDETFEKTLLALGKLTEESGQVAEALEIYDRGCERAIAQNSSRTVIFQAQKLRLASALGIEKELPKLYRACLHARDISPYFLFELEHALALAEARVASVEQILEGWTWLSTKVSHPADLALVMYDSLELL